MSAGVEPQEVGVAEPIDTAGSDSASAGGGRATRQPILDISDLSIAYRSGGGDVRAVRGMSTSPCTPARWWGWRGSRVAASRRSRTARCGCCDRPP